MSFLISSCSIYKILSVSQYDINKVTNIVFSCPFDNIVVYIIRSMINVEYRVSNKHAMQPPLVTVTAT